MRGSIKKILGFGLLGIVLATPVVMAQNPIGGRKGGASKHGKGGKGGKAGRNGKSKAPTKGGRGGN